MALFTLRAADEVRASKFGTAEGDLDTEMVAIAGAIIRQRTGHFDPIAIGANTGPVTEAAWRA